MGKHSNKEAYFKRLQELAEVNKRASVNETKSRTLGTLIDFKTAADGYTYGIVKENHHYYIKKSNKSTNPDVTDFAYIGGLGNITEFQYSKLSEADKNRNMILNTINEAYSRQLSKTSSKISKKKMLSESVDEDAEQEIAQAEDKFGDLEAATAAKAEPAPTPEMPDVGGKEFPETPTEEPAPDMGGEEGGEEMPDLEGLGLDDEGGEAPTEEPKGEEDDETPVEEPEGEKGELEPQDQESLVAQEIEKTIGKLGNRIRKTQLTDSQTNSYLKQILSAFKSHLKSLEIEDRKEIADLILKTVPDEDIADLDVSGEEEMEDIAEKKDVCAECGGFVQYAESRGYTSESILEATNEEVANLAAGYISAHKDGMNEGDYDSVARHLTNEVFDMLKEEYGYDDEDLAEYQTALNECGKQDRISKINELWGVDNTDSGESTELSEIESTNENLDDAAKVEVQPTFAQESQTLGVAINEAEEKVRKYVRARLEEKMGLRKSKLNESAKSESLKKLDSLIDKQFKLYETVVKKKNKK